MAKSSSPAPVQGDEAGPEISPHLKKLWFAYISGLIFWLVLTFGHTMLLWATNQLFIYKQEGSVFINDFLVFYNSGSLAWDSVREGINFYDPSVQKAAMEHFMGEKRDQIFYSQNPPYVFALLMPLALAPKEWSWMIWILLAIGGIIFSVQALIGETSTLKGKFTRVFAHICVLCAYPTWLCIKLGQVSLLAFPAYIWFWISLKKRMWFRAGLLGGFCLIKLQYAPIIFLTGAILGGVRFIAGYSLVALLFFTIPGLLFGWQTWAHYPQALRYSVKSTEVTGVNADGQQNLRGQLFVLLQGEDPTTRMAITAIWIVAALAAAFFWWRAKRRVDTVTGESREPGIGPSGAERRFMIYAALTVLVQLISSPHAHCQDYIFATLTCLWLMDALIGFFPLADPPLAREGLQLNSTALIVLRALLIGFPILSWAGFMYTKMFPVVVQPLFAWGVAVLSIVILTLASARKITGEASASD
ncbi:MAG: DUF2029 domain-containing protein [Cyanobacteria bacterium]|nr:DUF2029 domain-containing protein [Cyanobacteriota bacterium]